ncbi:hypothetical protein P9112_003982 [Eukaryota sp. TZLM1-RC]
MDLPVYHCSKVSLFSQGVAMLLNIVMWTTPTVDTDDRSVWCYRFELVRFTTVFLLHKLPKIWELPRQFRIPVDFSIKSGIEPRREVYIVGCLPSRSYFSAQWKLFSFSYHIDLKRGALPIHSIFGRKGHDLFVSLIHT